MEISLACRFSTFNKLTHLHQIKAVGGDADDPLFVLTARKELRTKWN
jgi:hypothetical protein